MGVTLERHPAVVATDLPAIYRLIARDDSAAAERVLDAVEATFDQLILQPECGMRYRTGNRKLTAVRMLPVIGFQNYLVFHRVEKEVIRILYVLHGSRHLTQFFRSEPRL